MAQPALEVADILRDHGPAWREANRGHVSLDQLKVMGAIERCRTAALGGHVARCENAACGHTEIAYNSCRNRHCPKCQGAASRRWLAEREAELLPVPYFHVVYTLPSELRDIAYQNKRMVYDLLMKAAAETTLSIATDPRRLGARIGITAVLHTWGSALTHHPHVHMIVPGGGLSLERTVTARGVQMSRTVAESLGRRSNASNRLSTELARSAHARTGSAIPLRSWAPSSCSSNKLPISFRVLSALIVVAERTGGSSHQRK